MDQQSRGRSICKRVSASPLVAALFALACQAQAQFLASKQPTALETALSRARFEMNCPGVNGQVLSSEVTQPALQGPVVAGIQRAEFTIV